MKWIACLLLALAASPALAQGSPPELAHAAKAEAYARAFLDTFANDPKLQAAVVESTKRHRKLDWEDSRALDKSWRDEMADGVRGGLVDAIIANELSAFLKAKQAEAPHGAVTEIYVIDGLGWNVAQTAPTSDFYQAEENRWQTVLPGEPGVALVSELEDYQGQGPALALVSLPLVEGERHIGVITIGVLPGKVP